jgi:DNA invertase Pin-like site-specific DNA recombinase
MIIGYARVSSGEQKMDMQLRALSRAGCRKIYQDHGQPGHDFKRDGLSEALDNIAPGQTLVVWRLDRLGRSLHGLIEVINELCRKQVHFRSLMENIDTSSSGGRLMFHMMGALAEFERNLISERTLAGLDEARIRGKQLGRPSLLSETQLRQAIHALHFQKRGMECVADEFGISVRTLRRHLQKRNYPEEMRGTSKCKPRET